MLLFHLLLSGEPVGVWWLDDGYPEGFYVDQTFEAYGASVVTDKRDGQSWEDYWEFLAGTAPYVADWRLGVGEEAPRAQLELMREVYRGGG
jgi:hypothetical protein